MVSHTPDERVHAYRYLCRRGARKFWRPGLEHRDLEQISAIGLIKAARRYDPAVGTPFEAYAWRIIVGELMHYVRDCERPVRVPRRLRALERRYLSIHEAFVRRFGREPAAAELARELGVLPPVIVEIQRARAAGTFVALDRANIAQFPQTEAIESEDRLLIAFAFSTLGKLERRIIVGVYLLGLTQLEISRRLGISAKRVSRVHHAALIRMQSAWAS